MKTQNGSYHVARCIAMHCVCILYERNLILPIADEIFRWSCAVHFNKSQSQTDCRNAKQLKIFERKSTDKNQAVAGHFKSTAKQRTPSMELFNLERMKDSEASSSKSIWSPVFWLHQVLI